MISDNVLSLLADQEGSLWVGTQEGLSQLTDLKLPIYSRGEGLLRGSTHNVCASANGGLWFTTSHGFGYFDGKDSVNYTNEGFLPNYWIRRAYEATNGNVYFIDGNKSIVVLAGSKITATYTNSVWPTDIGEDAEGMLVSLGSGLYRLRDGKTTPYTYKDGKGPELYWINNLRVMRDGSIWLASQNGVARIKDGEYKLWTTPEVGISPRFSWVCADDDGTIWAGMNSGIARGSRTRNSNSSRRRMACSITAYPPSWPTIRVPSGLDSTHGIFRVARKTFE